MTHGMSESECIKRITDAGMTFIEWVGEYKGSNSYVTILAHCGHKHTVKAIGPLYSTKKKVCRECRYNKKNISEADRIAQINSICDIEFDSWQSEYTPNHSSKLFVNIRCKLCENISTYRLDSILTKGCTCSECADDRIGGYNETTFNRNPEKKDINGVLYVLHISNQSESFYKVGISSRGKARIEGDLTANYDVDILSVIPMTLYEAFCLEQKTLAENERYKPKNYFAGHTECLVSCPKILKEQ